MPRFFFQHTGTGKRYDVVSIDKAAGTMRLRGPITKREFTETFDPGKFERMGYTLMQEPDDAGDNVH